MKTYLLSLLLSVTTFAALAQSQPNPAMEQRSDAPVSAKGKFYVGVEMSSISYAIADHYERIGGTFSPLAHVNVGYRLSERAKVQIGLTYGATHDNYKYIYSMPADTIYWDARLSNGGVAIPLTLQLAPFNPARRLNFFATASLIPIVGEIYVEYSEALDGYTHVVASDYDSGLYIIATAGIVLNYKVSQRLEGYGTANLLYKEVNREVAYAKQTKSVALGLNYNFNLKREK